jgi:transposase
MKDAAPQLLDTSNNWRSSFYMVKFTSEEKLQAALRYLNGKEIFRTVAADFGISHRYLLTLTKQYRKNGVEVFVRRYTNYTKAFKLDVLNYMTEHGTSLHETAAIFNIAASTSIRNWQKQFEALGEDALQPKKKGRLSMKKQGTKSSKKNLVEGSTEALQARIQQLEMENAYLKKLNALVQAKEASPRKTK